MIMKLNHKPFFIRISNAMKQKFRKQTFNKLEKQNMIHSNTVNKYEIIFISN